MAKQTYSDKLKDPRWQRKRLEIFSSDNFTCRLCGDDEETLHIHHKKYTAKNIWDEPKENLITICEHCHSVIHNKEYPFNDKNIFFEEGVKIYKSVVSNDGLVKVYNIIISHVYKITILCMVEMDDRLTFVERSTLYKSAYKIMNKLLAGGANGI